MTFYVSVYSGEDKVDEAEGDVVLVDTPQGEIEVHLDDDGRTRVNLGAIRATVVGSEVILES